MYRGHLEAFLLQKGSRGAVEINLDNIINQAQLKMKKIILEKKEINKKTYVLICKENIINENINFIKNEINYKKQIIVSMNEILNETNKEIKKLELVNKKVIKGANIKEQS